MVVDATLAILYEDGMRVVPQGRSGEGRGQLHNLGSFWIPCRQSPFCTCRASSYVSPLSYIINNETSYAPNSHKASYPVAVVYHIHRVLFYVLLLQ